MHGDIDLDVVVDDEHETGLNIIFEARSFYFQAVRPDREIGQSIAAVAIGDGCMDGLLVGFRHGNLGVDDGGAARIDDRAADLGHSHGLAVGRRKTENIKRATGKMFFLPKIENHMVPP